MQSSVLPIDAREGNGQNRLLLGIERGDDLTPRCNRAVKALQAMVSTLQQNGTVGKGGGRKNAWRTDTRKTAKTTRTQTTTATTTTTTCCMLLETATNLLHVTRDSNESAACYSRQQRICCM
ncbi:unnamed protein product [Ectocarpus sp. 12 AP-2014]